MKDWMKKLTGAGLTGRKKWLVRAAALLAILGLGGLLVPAAGIIPITASSGHWGITEWFLQFSKRRSVDTWSINIEPPPLDDPMLVQKGAAYYQIGCLACHGSPDLPHPRVAQAMLPAPPYLPERVGEWDAEELFYLTKHGIKFTGMPAWPDQQRDDEVWAMVAFLQKFPDLSAGEYRELAFGSLEQSDLATFDHIAGPGATPRNLQRFCASCHGAEGEGRGNGAAPRLAGQPREYLAGSLEAYLSGDRHSGIMQTAAAGLSSEDIETLASYYSQLQPADSEPVSTEQQSLIEQGEKLAREGDPTTNLPACSQCHGPGTQPRNPHYPQLAGLSARYLTLQLELFQQGNRGGTRFAHLMDPVAPQINAEQIEALAAYYDSLSE